MNKIQRGFTLYEVLITILVIGIVAVLTLTSLITKINNKVAENQIKVIESKLKKGVNLYKVLDNGFHGNYTTTFEFVKGLSKHFKMIAMCDTDEIEKCIPYSTISYTKFDNSYENIEVSSIKSSDKLIKVKSDNWLPPASFITADGTPYIITLKKDCIIASDSMDITKENAMLCIDGIYDYSGSKLPNRFGKDIKPIAKASLGCTLAINNVCYIKKPFKPEPISYSQCLELKDEYGIPH